MNKQAFSLLDAFTWLLKRYQELQQQIQQQAAYRIVAINTNEIGESQLKIQLVGKATVFECTPNEIVADDRLLECFSKKDIRTITYFATQEICKPKYQIAAQEVQEKSRHILFKIRTCGSTQTIEKTANEISQDKNLLKQFSQEDAHIIGYTTASEQIAQDKEQMEKLLNKMQTSDRYE